MVWNERVRGAEDVAPLCPGLHDLGKSIMAIGPIEHPLVSQGCRWTVGRSKRTEESPGRGERNSEMMRLFVSALCLFFLIPIWAPGLRAQSRTGAITGVVADSETGTALPGARVVVGGTGLSTYTDVNGVFYLGAVPAGSQTLEVSYLGYQSFQEQLEVAEFSSYRLDVRLQTLSRETATVVAEPFRQGRAKALNQQKTSTVIKNVVAADQIGRFPDSNAAEATQRIPGVALQRDQGEGRFIIVRGTEARLNSVAINGQRLPSPEGDIRFVALDVIPADVLEAIELTKAPTADMDADAIGGNVNLLTKRAPEDPLLTFSAGWGYNNLVRDDLQSFNLAAGRRFTNNKLGIIFAASWLNTDRGSDNFEVRYDDGELDEFELRDYAINRERLGLVFGIDYRTENNSEFFVNAIFNQFDDQEFRRRNRQRVAVGEIERELKDRLIRQQIASLSVGGRHFFDNLLQLDYTVSYSYASENEPNRADSVFTQKDVIFQPNVSPTSIDPDNIRANPLNEDISAFEFSRLVE